MILILTIVSLVTLALIVNFIYIKVVLRETQEEHIIRGKKERNAYVVVSFGSSYARYAFDFSETTLKGYNFGLLPQFLYYTDKMIRDYRKSYKDKAVILIVLPNLAFGDPGKGKYGANRYAKLLSRKSLGDEFSFKNVLFIKLFPLLKPSLHNLKICVKNILNYRKEADGYNRTSNQLTVSQVKESAKQRCNDWIREFHLQDTKTDVVPKSLEEKFAQSRDILTSTIDYCLKESLRPVLVVTPVSTQMKEELSDRFIKKVLFDNISLANKANVPVLNYLCDERFTHYSNFANNSDFLNAKARKEFSQVVINDALAAYNEHENR